MPTSDLAQFEHEVALEDGTVSLRFGPMSSTYVTTTHPQIEGASGGTVGDVQRMREDGVSLGEDFLGPKTVTFELAVLTDRGEDDPHAANGEALDVLAALWEDDRFRSNSSAYAVLRSHMVPGRVRRAYGRPRNYADTPDRGTHRGITPALCSFTVEDGVWYDDAEHSITTRAPAYNGDIGFTSPLTTPITTLQPTEGWTGMIVGGRKPTWPVITFFGPATNPVATVGDGVKVGLSMNIAAGDSVVYDPRPWRRSVTRRSDGASMAGKLTWDSTPLRRAKIRPGSYDVSYKAIDPTGVGGVTVTWRNAHPRW